MAVRPRRGLRIARGSFTTRALPTPRSTPMTPCVTRLPLLDNIRQRYRSARLGLAESGTGHEPLAQARKMPCHAVLQQIDTQHLTTRQALCAALCGSFSVSLPVSAKLKKVDRVTTCPDRSRLSWMGYHRQRDPYRADQCACVRRRGQRQTGRCHRRSVGDRCRGEVDSGRSYRVLWHLQWGGIGEKWSYGISATLPLVDVRGSPPMWPRVFGGPLRAPIAALAPG